ncbi:MAG: tRNA 2-thiouridine(34) synthase MnmA, partial [Thermoplasmata archaeon]|nr:tRNA 2-thiouridine(34) synthase MnmA [Thermoplasmata archaeon]
EEDTYKNTLIAKDINWIALNTLNKKMNVKAKIRSTHKGSDASIKLIGEDAVYVEFQAPQQAVSIGQSVVFYDDDTIIGGGIIHG